MVKRRETGMVTEHTSSIISTERIKAPQIFRCRAHARLHIGLLQMSQEYLHINGGAGFALAEPYWEFEIERYSGRKGGHIVANIDLSRELQRTAEAILHSVVESAECGIAVRVTVTAGVEQHVGLGAGTAFRVGLATGLRNALGGSALTARDWQAVGRGGTSGIGVNLCISGGFVVDLGRRRRSENDWLPSSAITAATRPNVLTRQKMPKDWQILLVRVRDKKGVHGRDEAEIFREHLPLPGDEVRRAAGILYFEILPSLAMQDIREFGNGLRRFQDVGFKRIEWSLQDRLTWLVRDFIERNCDDGFALSSFGPTIAIVTRKAEILKISLQKIFGDDLVLLVTSPF